MGSYDFLYDSALATHTLNEQEILIYVSEHMHRNKSLFHDKLNGRNLNQRNSIKSVTVMEVNVSIAQADEWSAKVSRCGSDLGTVLFIFIKDKEVWWNN